MKTTTLKFTGPQVKHLSFNKDKTKMSIMLNYPIWGDVEVNVWKEGNTFKYNDEGAPIKVRSFGSIDQMMWEYELPKVIQPYVEQLV